ncbi:uncharacterized protein LOC111634928 [Centruroides sculpturatus]|uniref:uncharacterized protein LOC111634928 n=1 Tax=Centruroides sculpturatus TaxID=218467 RepID=UPI000C6CD7DC|nr:uncharacterized protein LOC111634928 [Centruroides sculpturatus]
MEASADNICSGCEYNFFEAVGYSEERIKEELLRHGIWRNKVNCGRCGNPLNAQVSGLRFHCGKTIRRGKKRPTKCDWSRSVWAGTFLENKQIDFVTLWRFILTLLIWKPPRTPQITRFLGLTQKTIVYWYSFCREVFIHDVFSKAERLGGQDRVVEVGEAKLKCWKFDKDSTFEGESVFWGVERETLRNFLISVDTCDGDTLLSVLREWVVPGATVMSDCWKAYDCLENEGFRRLTVDYSYNFVDIRIGSHLNPTNNTWREICSSIPRKGVRKDKTLGYLAEGLFKAKYPDLAKRHHHFLIAAAKLYPPDY